jgi:hypothetical protein
VRPRGVEVEGTRLADLLSVTAIIYLALLPLTLLLVLPLVLRGAIRRRRDPLPWFLATMFGGPLGLAVYLYPPRPDVARARPVRTPASRIPHRQGMRSPSCPLCGQENPPGHVCHPARVSDRIHRRIVTRVGELPYIQ